MKSQWQIVNELKNLSGWGWDSANKFISADTSSLEDYLKEHKDASFCYNRKEKKGVSFTFQDNFTIYYRFQAS